MTPPPLKPGGGGPGLEEMEAIAKRAAEWVAHGAASGEVSERDYNIFIAKVGSRPEKWVALISQLRAAQEEAEALRADHNRTILALAESQQGEWNDGYDARSGEVERLRSERDALKAEAEALRERVKQLESPDLRTVLAYEAGAGEVETLRADVARLRGALDEALQEALTTPRAEQEPLEYRAGYRDGLRRAIALAASPSPSGPLPMPEALRQIDSVPLDDDARRALRENPHELYEGPSPSGPPKEPTDG